MSETPHTRILLVCMVVVALTLGGLTLVLAGPGAAQEDQSTLDQLSDADSDAVMAGLFGRIDGWINARLAFLSGEEITSADACGDLQSEFNANNATVEEWVNARTNATTDLDTVALTCDTSDETDTVYLTASVNSTTANYTSAEIVDSTDRDPDATCVLEEDAADNAADELDTFITDYASTGANVSEEFRTRLAAQYAGDVSCDGLAGVSG